MMLQNYLFDEQKPVLVWDLRPLLMYIQFRTPKTLLLLFVLLPLQLLKVLPVQRGLFEVAAHEAAAYVPRFHFLKKIFLKNIM